MRDTIITPFRIRLENGFGVTLGGETMSLATKLRAQILIVINRAVEHDDIARIAIKQRLIRTFFQINDGETTMPQRHGATLIKRLMVRATECQLRGH